MRKIREWKRNLVALLGLVPFLVILPGLAQDPIEDEDSYCNSRKALALMEQLAFDCAALEAQGVGLGEIDKAWRLSQSLPGFEGDWEELLQLKQEGVGWGEIRKAQALDEAGIRTFDEALDGFLNGIGWGEIKAEEGLEGPPPWAGNGRDKDKPGRGGPPPWSNGRGRGNGG